MSESESESVDVRRRCPFLHAATVSCNLSREQIETYIYSMCGHASRCLSLCGALRNNPVPQYFFPLHCGSPAFPREKKATVPSESHCLVPSRTGYLALYTGFSIDPSLGPIVEVGGLIARPGCCTTPDLDPSPTPPQHAGAALQQVCPRGCHCNRTQASRLSP